MIHQMKRLRFKAKAWRSSHQSLSASCSALPRERTGLQSSWLSSAPAFTAAPFLCSQLFLASLLTLLTRQSKNLIFLSFAYSFFRRLLHWLIFILAAERTACAKISDEAAFSCWGLLVSPFLPRTPTSRCCSSPHKGRHSRLGSSTSAPSSVRRWAGMISTTRVSSSPTLQSQFVLLLFHFPKQLNSPFPCSGFALFV